MAKIVLDDTTSGYNLTKINNNFQKIETELNEKVLYRDNPVGEPNEMQDDLDMNSNRIYNLPVPVLENEPVRLKDLQDSIAGRVNANTVIFEPYKDITSTNVQGAIQEVKDDVDAIASDIGNLTDSDIEVEQPFVGSVVRTQHDKNAESISVKDFGAVGDGITDDTEAFQTAYDSSPVDGVILVPYGNYAGTMPTGTKRVMWVSEGAKTANGLSWLSLPGRHKTIFDGREIQFNDKAQPAQGSDNFIIRDANYVGGNFGNVNAAQQVKTTVSAGAKDFEWAFLAEMDNSATQTDDSQNVAVYGQAIKRSFGSTWASCFEIQDKTNAEPAIGSTIGVEVASSGNGSDTNFQRVGVHIAMGKNDQAGVPCEWGRGFWTTAGSDSRYIQAYSNNGPVTHAVYHNEGNSSGMVGSTFISDEGRAETGIDLSHATYDTNAAIRLAADQIIYLEQTGTVGIRYNSSNGRIEFIYQGVARGHVDLSLTDHAF